MELREELKQIIIESLALEEITPSDIKDDEPLFNEGLGLDSIDALELGMALKRKYDITLESNKEENQKYFYSVSTLADFVESKEKFTKEQIFDELKKILVEELEINDGDIVPEANLFEDLDLDSIDAVDIAVRMQKFTDKKLSPAEFKKIRTVNDVVEAVYGLLG